MGSYETCPRKFKLNYIDKIKVDSEPSLALARGSFTHIVLENNFDYDIDFPTNDIFTQTEKDKTIEMIKKFRVSDLGKMIEKLIPISIIEEDFAFNAKMELVDFKDKTAWLRGSGDLIYYNKEHKKASIIDYKTGKDKSQDEKFGLEQGIMYGIYVLYKFPDIQEVKATFVFVEHSTKKSFMIYRSELPKYLKMFFDKTKNIEGDKFFPEKVTALCDYCDFKDIHCDAPSRRFEDTESFMKTKIIF